MLKYRKLPGGTDEFTPPVPNADERWFFSLLWDCIVVINILLVLDDDLQRWKEEVYDT